MPLLNREKVLNGVGKAVDAVNHAADKTGEFVKEKEIDKKVEHAAEVVGREMKRLGEILNRPFPIIKNADEKNPVRFL